MSAIELLANEHEMSIEQMTVITHALNGDIERESNQFVFHFFASVTVNSKSLFSHSLFHFSHQAK